MHQQAAVDANEPAAFTMDESQRPAFSPHIKAGMVAIVQFIRRRQCVGYGSLDESSHPLESISHDPGFGCQLRRICQVLPLAAGTFAVNGTGRFGAVRRRRDDADNLGGNIFAPNGNNLRVYSLPGNTAENENVATIVGCQRLTETSPGKQFQTQCFAPLRSALRWCGCGFNHT